MEPRPQSTRAGQPQPTSRQPAAGGPPEEGGPYQQPDPTTMVAPPRTDYDYSPLDLAPPGQRRRRQLVAAALGGLLMLVLVAAIVFAFLALRDTGDDENGVDLAFAQTQIAAATSDAAQSSTPTATEPPAEETQAAGDETDAEPTPTAGLDAAGESAAIDPTQPAAPTTGGGLGADQLMAMLPASEALPITGLSSVEDSSLTEAEVVEALGGGRDAETKLSTWGWSGNATRQYIAPDPSILDPTATTNITVSLHGFGNEGAAAEALTFYSDVLLNIGYQEVEVGEIGASNRMMTQPQEDGGTLVALYVQQGPILYRIGGYSPAGDPTTNVVSVAQYLISQQNVAVGQ